MTTRETNWQPNLLAPESTLWLPVGGDRPLTKDEARQSAVEILGTDAAPKRLREFARIILEETNNARDASVMKAALLFFPDRNRLPPVATLNLHAYYPSDPENPTTLEFYREAFGTPDEDTIGEIEVTAVDLPVGPALRFHKRWKEKAGWKPSYLHESVTYAVRPRQIPDAVVIRLIWQELAMSSALIKAADGIARTLEIELLDEG